jgi:hypothetical protein
MRVPKTLTEKLSNTPVGASPHGNQFDFKGVVEATNFNMLEQKARQTVVEKWRQGAIQLHIWSGERECSFQSWLDSGRTEEQFFLNTTDSGYVRVRRSPGLLGLVAR